MMSWKTSARQLLGADQYILQATELLRGAAPHVGLQERRRGNQERNLVFAHKRIDTACVQDWEDRPPQFRSLLSSPPTHSKWPISLRYSGHF